MEFQMNPMEGNTFSYKIDCYVENSFADIKTYVKNDYSDRYGVL